MFNIRSQSFNYYWKKMNISFDDFLAYFSPVANTSETATSPLINDQLYGFETFGSDLVHIQTIYKEKPECIWTVLDADGEIVIASGFHHVNRIAFIVTAVKAPAKTMIDVHDEPPDPTLRYGCFARYNGATPGIQQIMDVIGNETFENYAVWMQRMLNTWSIETRLSRVNMTPKHYSLFDAWLSAYVNRPIIELKLAA